jgi:DNA mismatch repair protein MLH3
LTERRIPCVKPSYIAPTPGHFPDKHGCHTPRKLEIGCDNLTFRFTRDDLRRAEIINQVDNKFIACRIAKRNYHKLSVNDIGREPYSDSPILVLVDQHAGDERIRVERLLKDLCLGFLHSQDQTEDNLASKYVFSRALAPSRPVLLTQHEALTISQSQDIQESFRKWGVRFTELSKTISDSGGASEPVSNIGYLQLYVSAIPEVVGDKVRLRSLFCLCRLFLLTRFVCSFYKETSCGISSKDSSVKSRMESYSWILLRIFLLRTTMAKKTSMNISG